MRGLSQFTKFDWQTFSAGKVFVVTGVSDWVDFGSKERLGTKVEVVIAVDKTQYNFREGQIFSNRFEKLVFKTPKSVDLSLEAKVIPQGVVATVYGEFKNQLSIKCEDVVLLPASGATSKEGA